MDYGSNISIEAVEAALETIIASPDYVAGCPVKVVRKKLEKVLKIPKKSLKGADADISIFLKVDTVIAYPIYLIYSPQTLNERAAAKAIQQQTVPPIEEQPPAVAGEATGRPKPRSKRKESEKSKELGAMTAGDAPVFLNSMLIRTKVMELLKSESLDELTLRKVMMHLTDVFQIDVESLSSYKDEIKSVIVDFKDALNIAGLPHTFRFSKAEDEIILRVIQQYKDAKNLTDEDLNPRLAPEGVRTRNINKELWTSLVDVMPHRTYKSIWARAMKIINETNGKWSEEQLDYIKVLVDQGVTWAEIAKKVGATREDCRSAFYRSLKRKVRGKFTAEEDQRLRAAVLKTSSGGNEVLLEGIKWIEVAKEMNDERFNTDYCKRWRVLHAQKLKEELLSKAAGTIDEQKKVLDENRCQVDDQIIQYIIDCGAEDSSEVTWTTVDRTFGWGLGTAGKRWAQMMKSLPAGTKFTEAAQTLQRRRASGRPAILMSRKPSRKNGGDDDHTSERTLCDINAEQVTQIHSSTNTPNEGSHSEDEMDPVVKVAMQKKRSAKKANLNSAEGGAVDASCSKSKKRRHVSSSSSSSSKILEEGDSKFIAHLI